MIYLPEEVLYSAVIGFFSSLAINSFFNREKKSYQPSGLVKGFERMIKEALLDYFKINSFGCILSFPRLHPFQGYIMIGNYYLEKIEHDCAGDLWSSLSKKDKKYLREVWKTKLESNKEIAKKNAEC